MTGEQTVVRVEEAVKRFQSERGLIADGVTGPHSVAFSAAGLSALEGAINGTDATIGISFREFSADDALDGFVFGVPDNPGMTIDVTAVPEPSTGLLAMFGLTVVGWVRRRQ